jgi:ATP-dependent DNA helicase RecG
MYLAGYIERMGTGTSDMVRIARKNHLPEPEFIQEDSFIVKVFRPETKADADQVTPQVTPQVALQVRQLLNAIKETMTRDELQEKLQLKDRENFRKNYLLPGLNAGLIEMTLPEKPTSKNQKYRLTEKGRQLKTKLKEK